MEWNGVDQSVMNDGLERKEDILTGTVRCVAWHEQGVSEYWSNTNWDGAE